jgi:predicted GH43/DUF377 family glycosyl hydrolase
MLDLQEFLKKRMGDRLQQSEASSPFKKKRKNGLIWLLFVAIMCSLGTFGWFYKHVKTLERKQKAMHRSIKMLECGAPVTRHMGGAPIPYRLSGVPSGEDLGIVLGVKKVDIRHVEAPYNPSLIESASGYDLFFRYDVISRKLKYAPFSSHIGVVSLSSQFEQHAEEFKPIDLGTAYADDPRALFVGDQLYLFYNRLDEGLANCRFMCAVNLDRNSYAVNYSTILDPNLQWVEKNWSPFEYIGEDQKSRLFLEYRICPRKLFELPNPKINELCNVTLPKETAYFSPCWSQKWGEMRGGTPAKKIGDEYLGFFHSWFQDERGVFWYVMGAYMFDAHPPFNITRISKYPILFNGIYETPIINTASNGKRVIFPSGFVLEKTEDQELIHLACGENDCSVKIVTIDKEKLIETMIQFEREDKK